MPDLVIHATDDFQFEWPDPADASQPWMWDQMHQPRPLPLLAGIIALRMMDHVMGGRGMLINGFGYRAMGAPPAWAASLLNGDLDPLTVDPIAIWEGDQLPKLQQIISDIRGRDYESMSSVRIAGMLDELIGESARALALTFGRAMAFSVATNALVDFCEVEDPAGGALRATSMLQGFENESSASGEGLSRLAEMAAGLPAVAAALREGRFADIEASTGGAEFMAAFRSYLETYGWRAPSWGQVHLPTWAEDPEVPLRLLASYLENPERRPSAALQRARTERDTAIAQMEAALAPDKLSRFRALLKAAQASVPVSEGRAMWQLICSGVLRIPLMTLSRKLVGERRLANLDDIFHFSVNELVELADSGRVPAPRELVAQRRADLERWEKLSPPRFIGAPLGFLPPMMARFFGVGVEQGADGRVVKGIAASKGVVRARARLILDLGESDRLGAGEVLVCPSTAPPWTPLFAIASAVVSDTGGVLSHTAIAAREYAIPAVVGTGVATRRIPDGATVTVDGAQGIVRIED